MDKITLLAKLKFDLRDPDEAHFAGHELAAILNSDVKPVRTIPFLFREHPFNKLNEVAVRIITRNLYLGEVQGYLAKVKNVRTDKLIYGPAFFREIYLIVETSKSEEKLRQKLSLTNGNLFQIFTANDGIFVVRLFPIQTLFEYVTDVKKLPYVAITPRGTKNLDEYLTEKEKGIEKGLEELIYHLRNNHFRAPHLGLGKKHIGDFVDWASTDLRKPFLHYLHKYKGKGDPRISRALINLLKVDEGATILDPFAGSGAFIADAPTMGLNAVGVEILRIGKLISEVKGDLSYDIQRLRGEIVKLFSGHYRERDMFSGDISGNIRRIRENLLKQIGDSKPVSNILPHLKKITYLKSKIENIKYEKAKKFLLLMLSQKIIEFSEKKRNNDFTASFRNYVEDRYLTLYATLKLAEKLGISLSRGKIRIVKADSTSMHFLEDESIDGILTSPPYFDALDYIGNNKVSIVILGFDEDLKFGATKEYYSKFDRYALELPESSKDLIALLEKSRRSSKANVVRNYLKMMKLSFRECYRVLKPKKYYVMVVSKYHRWLINGEERRVETSRILSELGVSEGFKLVDVIQHGLSKADKGKINIEDILIFQK